MSVALTDTWYSGSYTCVAARCGPIPRCAAGAPRRTLLEIERVPSGLDGYRLGRRSLCACGLWNLLSVEHERLFARGTAQLRTRVVYRQRLAVG